MKLSDFKDEKAIEVVAKLLVPMGNIAGNAKNLDARNKGLLPFASALLQNNAKDVMAMFAILNDMDPGDYHCDAVTVLKDTLEMLNDPALLELFGLQGQTQVSSGSASTIGEAVEASKVS